MKATRGKNCPVASFKAYVQRLNPKQSAFFQRPKNTPSFFGPWYDNVPIGVKMLEKIMKGISKAANLTTLYTNHCIRATSNNPRSSRTLSTSHYVRQWAPL